MVRALLVVSKHEPLVESATILEQSVRAGVPPSVIAKGRPLLATVAADIGLGTHVKLYNNYSAVSLGTGDSETPLNALRADRAEKFVVRADVPEEMVRDGYVNNSPVFSDPDIAAFQPICPGDSAVGDVADVRALHKVAAASSRGLDGNRVAIAIMDTGISSAHLASKGIHNRVDASVVWNSLTAVAAAGGIVPPGHHRLDHGTMCAFDVLIGAPNGRLLDYPILHGTPAGAISGSQVGGALGDALVAYAHLESFWLVTFGPSRSQYDSLVVNNSWGVYHPSWDFAAGHPGRYIDNPNHPFNQKVDVMARHGVDVIFAAGNCGSQCPAPACMGNVAGSIMGANAHSAVLTVAGTSVHGGRIGYSSEGPPIVGMGAPQKPDIAAATHFVGSESSGPGVPDTGTSTACPVAAGCVAALRSALAQSSFPPQQIFRALRNTAFPGASTPTGWNAQYGHGIIDLNAAAISLGV